MRSTAAAWAALGIGVFGVAACAGAQLTVTCRLEHDRVLQFEPIWATITVRNATGIPLRIRGEGTEAAPDPGEEPVEEAVLEIGVESSPRDPLARRARPLLDEPVTIAPRQSASIVIDLVPLFVFRRQGPYTVEARLRWDDEVFIASRRFVDVLPGMVVSSYRAVLADPPGERRALSLRTLTRDRMEYLFLRIDDERADVCLGVFNLGTITRIFPPTLLVDASDRVHVLHQSAPARFTHSIIHADGVPVDMVFYNPAGGTRPALVEDEAGRVHPTGVRPYRGDPVVEPARGPVSRPR